MTLPASLTLLVVVLFAVPGVVGARTHRLTVVLPIALRVTGGATHCQGQDRVARLPISL